MARAGGQSTATGVTFQGLAVARAIVDVLQENADLVRPEAPPHAEIGGHLQSVIVDDYVVQRAGRRTYYQAKSNAPNGGTWTLEKLTRKDEHILQDFLKQLAADPEAECCLVTPCGSQLLGDVAGLAAKNVSAAEFIKNLPARPRKEFEAACQKLDITPEEGYRMLKRCRLEIRTLDQMLQELRTLAEYLFSDPVSAVDSLHSIAIHAMRQGQNLDAVAVQALVNERSVFARPKATDEELVSAVQKAGAQLRSVSHTINGVHIPMPVVDRMLAWTTEAPGGQLRMAALLDQAGSGKTVAMKMLMERLETAGYVVLGIKADKLTFASHEDLAKCLDLPGSVQSVVQRLAFAGKDMVVPIDQLDALSSAMSRLPTAIQVTLDLVAQLVRLQHVTVIVACRSVDWRYDHRIRSLQDHSPKEFVIPELVDEQINSVLLANQLKCSDLHPVTVQVIRRPLHLDTFVRVLSEHQRLDSAWSPTNRPIYTLQSLYQDLWSLKMSKAAEQSGPGAADCETVAGDIATQMHATQQFTVPEAAVAIQRPVVNWLASEGILDRNGKTLSFFHQTFFDFMFARHFAGSGISLVDHLVGTRQDLFYRPMVRQVLEYLRDADPFHYQLTLAGTLTDVRIRKHLRWVAIAWLSQLADPGIAELEAVKPLLAEPVSRRRVLSYMKGNASWFDRIGLEWWKHWLDTLPEGEVHDVVWFLWTVVKHRQDAVCRLLEQYVGRDQSWNRAVGFCLAGLEGEWGDRAADLLTRLIRDPKTELDAEHPWWGHGLESLAKSQPVKACEAVRFILGFFEPRWSAWAEGDRRQKRSMLSADEERLFPRAYEFRDILTIGSEKSPAAFLDTVLPWALRCMDLTCQGRSDLWFRYDYEHVWDPDDLSPRNSTGLIVLLIESACRTLAANDPIAFRRYMAAMLNVDVQPIQRVIAQSYASRPGEYASDAAEFLRADKRRLMLSSYDTADDTVELIVSCAQHWSDQEYRDVEQSILDAKIEHPETPDDLRWSGQRHLQLLLAIDDQRLSGRGKALLGLLQRKFPGIQLQRPPRRKRGLIPTAKPPVPKEARAKMDDAAWLSAMRHYGAPFAEPGAPAAWRDGRLEMSEALKEHAKEQPDRFMRLAREHLSAAYHPGYLAAILEGYAAAGSPVQHLLDLVNKHLPLLEKGHIGQVAEAVGHYAENGVPENLNSSTE